MKKAFSSGKITKDKINKRGYSKFLRIENDVNITLQQLGMHSYFDRIITGNAERNTKHEALNELLNVYHLSPSEIVYIGDTVSDIMQCKIVNVVCLSAAWNVDNSVKEDLERYNRKRPIFRLDLTI